MSNEASQQDGVIRRQVYEAFIQGQGAPSPADLANQLNLPTADVLGSLRRLAEARALVLEPAGEGIRMAPPFSAIPTDVRVEAAGGSWWAPCAWDGLGIPALLRKDARLITTCPDCGDEIALRVEGGVPGGAPGVMHLAVPAAHWWDDIFFT